MKHLLYAFSSGILLALSWPTYGFPLLLFFSFVPLLLAEFNIRTLNIKFSNLKILGLAYVTFFTWNITTTYWLYFSTPFGMWFAVLANSLLMSLVFLIYHIVAKRVDFKASIAFLVCLWISFELLHLHWDFSWPWLNLGNGFSDFSNWIQWYEYTGTFGGTLWVWLGNIIFFKMLLIYRQHKEKEIIFRGIFKASLLILLPILVSYVILWNYSESEKTVDVVVLQPNINPYTEKYNTSDAKIGPLLNRLAVQGINDSTELVIAPETVYADGTSLKNFSYSYASHYSKVLVKNHPTVNFLGGISMYNRFSDPEKVKKQTNQIGLNDWYDDYNSAFLINATDSIQMYHKSKLVVGVENFPYQSFLKPILGNIMIDLGGTVAMKTTQPERSVFELKNGYKVAPIICYESVYGEYVTGYVNNGAEFLAIITNDAWWGNTQGHKQHLSYAKLRAIENRRSIARSANTGISALINEKGKIESTLGYEEQGQLSGKISRNSEITFYTKHGDIIARVAPFIALLIFIFSFLKYKRRR
ncbi:MAG TPA: apolipoprotein N-acyltransferase [Salinimicrobium sp.]|nr:apolipoprotein N-acyltransferase [Salinimicrobium sp.]